MKPRPFDYLRPETIEEAVAALAQYGDDARILAGGQSLVAMLNFRLAEPLVLIDVSRLAELDTIEHRGEALEVGAAVTQNRLLAWPGLRQVAPLLAAALPWVGHFQTRNRGTICGSIAQADPSAELPLALALLGGDIVLRSARGERRVPAADFQQGLMTTARVPDELITGVRFPTPAAYRRAAFREVARRHGDFAIVAVGVVAEAGDAVRLGVAGLADRPAVRRIEATQVTAAVDTLARELGGWDDMHASPRYRRDLLRRLGPIVVAEALACAA